MSNRLVGGRSLLVILVLIVVIGVAVWLFLASRQDDSAQQPISLPEPSPPAEVVPEPTPPEVSMPAEPEPEPEPEPVLPPLDDSDGAIRESVAGLSRHEGVPFLLTTSDLVRKLVAFTDNVALGKVAKEPAVTLAPRGAFDAQEISEDRYQLDSASFARYNRVVDVLASIDAKGVAALYHLMRPVFQEAYDELGYQNADFDDALLQALNSIENARVMDEPIWLVRPSVMYKFEDESLESLSEVQKQLIRMGPRNTRLVQARAAEFSQELRKLMKDN